MQSSEVTTPSESEHGSNYKIRIQSLPLPLHWHRGYDVGAQLKKDITNRVCEAGDNLAFNIFPDDAFGFSINEKLAENFHDVFLCPGGTINPDNFKTEQSAATFLNRIITTLARFLHAAGQNHVKILRYFSASHSTVPIRDPTTDRKPDIVLLRLVDGSYTRDGRLDWKDVQALIEHTFSKDPPIRMARTVTDKNYLMFCAQPERNFIISLCITKSGVSVVVSDHVGQISTDTIHFDRPSSVLVFLRLVMGFAFLPDKCLGIDDTMIRRVHGQKSSAPHTFESLYPPYQSEFKNPKITLLVSEAPVLSIRKPLAITTDAAKQDECPDFDTIAIGSKTYKVLKVLFESKAFIGRATKVFLVQFEDGRQGALKDSFITIDRPTEASILENLSIPFGPDIVDHCTFDDTNTFRKSLLKPAAIHEVRQKRRVVTYPAGVHISDFTSLWELMVAFLDVAVGTSCW